MDIKGLESCETVVWWIRYHWT